MTKNEHLSCGTSVVPQRRCLTTTCAHGKRASSASILTTASMKRDQARTLEDLRSAPETRRRSPRWMGGCNGSDRLGTWRAIPTRPMPALRISEPPSTSPQRYQLRDRPSPRIGNITKLLGCYSFSVNPDSNIKVMRKRAASPPMLTRFDMKNLFLASAVALASIVAISTPSQAAPYHRHHHRDCVVKTVKHKVHGHWVVRKERVCR